MSDNLIYNYDDYQSFIDNSEMATVYKDCFFAIRNAYCINKNLQFIFTDKPYQIDLNKILGSSQIKETVKFSLSKETYDFNSISKDKRNINLFISKCFFHNFLHFIMDLFMDYLFYLELKKMKPTLLFYSHNKKEFLETIRKLKLFDSIDPFYNIENDLFDGDFNNSHFDLVVFPYKNFSEIRKSFKFDIYFNYANMMKKYIQNYKNENLLFHDYIYISRRIRDDNKTICNSQRNLLNEKDLISTLQKFKFKEIFLEDYDSIFDKLLILKNANIIVLQSSATCILLSMTDLQNLIILSGPYKLSIFPDSKNNKVKSLKIINSNNFEKTNQIINCPWSLTNKNLIELKNHLSKLLYHKNKN